MKNYIFLIFPIFLLNSVIYAQENEQKKPGDWEISSDLNLYFFSDDFIVLPVVKADKGKLHVEGRYNYEDIETFSAWAGINFSGGEKFEFVFTPMVGGIAGLSKGMAPGLEITLNYQGFEFYSESEYFIEAESEENNFYYNWTDISYAPNDRFWFGISGQRTKLYQTELDIQRGFLMGTSLKNFEMSAYFFNIGFDEPFFITAFSFVF